MNRLNNKGITTIEVLVCFVLVVVITVSMYSVISAFNEQKTIASYKEEIITYTNILTKDIQDDFIKIGVVKATHEQTNENGKIIHTLTCTLKDNSTRVLKVSQQFGKSDYHPDGADVDDEYKIQYGKANDLIDYPLPDLGSSESASKKKILDLSIDTVLIDISSQNILSIYIGFKHPDLSTRYAVDVVTPVNYVFGGGTSNLDPDWDELDRP